MNKRLPSLAPGPIGQIRLDHSHVLVTFHQYKLDTPPRRKLGLVNTICAALEVHAQLEEEIFYPAIRALADNEVIRKSVPEHDEMRRLIGKLRAMEPTAPGYDDTVMELMRDVIHHVADEETVLLPEAERLLGNQLPELGARMAKRRMQLVLPRTGEIACNTLRALPTAKCVAIGLAVLAGATWGIKQSRRS